MLTINVSFNVMQNYCDKIPIQAYFTKASKCYNKPLIVFIDMVIKLIR